MKSNFQVTASKNRVHVMRANIHSNTFTRAVDQRRGQEQIRWRRVPCQPWVALATVSPPFQRPSDRPPDERYLANLFAT
jgi:hypothetical protein